MNLKYVRTSSTMYSVRLSDQKIFGMTEFFFASWNSFCDALSSCNFTCLLLSYL